MTRIRTLVAVLAIALPILVVVAGCGGGSSSSNEDPQQVLDQTFSNPTKITSGNLDISLDGSAEGDQSGTFNASISGPFQAEGNDPTTFPQFDLTANVSGSAGGPSISFDGSLIATKDNAYVEYQDQAYEVGTDLFKQFTTSYAQAAQQSQTQKGQNFFEQFGIDPSTWLTNVSNEGTTDVEGTDTIHIHGDADIAKIFSDLQQVSQQAGGTTQQVTPEQLKMVQDAVKQASIDVYSGTDDHLLRKLSLALQIEPPAGTGATVSSVDVNFSIAFSDVNQPQTITAPSNAKPLSELLNQLGIPGLPGIGGSTGGFSLPGGTGGASGSSYQNCIAQAKTPSDIQKCATKL
ncbi:MAG: hypothetical protein ACJ75I_08215 [Solirubrobacterales bacterium]